MPGRIVGYGDALRAVGEAARSGVGVYDMAVAFELESAISLKKKAFRRRKKFLEKLDADAPELYAMAVRFFVGAAGGSTPKEAANEILDSYLNCGMDLFTAKAMLYAVKSPHVI